MKHNIPVQMKSDPLFRDYCIELIEERPDKKTKSIADMTRLIVSILKQEKNKKKMLNNRIPN